MVKEWWRWVEWLQGRGMVRGWLRAEWGRVGMVRGMREGQKGTKERDLRPQHHCTINNTTGLSLSLSLSLRFSYSLFLFRFILLLSIASFFPAMCFFACCISSFLSLPHFSSVYKRRVFFHSLRKRFCFSLPLQKKTFLLFSRMFWNDQPHAWNWTSLQNQ